MFYFFGIELHPVENVQASNKHRDLAWLLIHKMLKHVAFFCLLLNYHPIVENTRLLFKIYIYRTGLL